MPRSAHQAAQQKRREARCVRLRIAGHSFDDIARRVGYANRGGAYKAYVRGMDRLGMEEVEEIFRLNYERYNAMLYAIWPEVSLGDLSAIREALTILDRLDRLAGVHLQRCDCRGSGIAGADTQQVAEVDGALLVIEVDEQRYRQSMIQLAHMYGRQPGDHGQVGHDDDVPPTSQ